MIYSITYIINKINLDIEGYISAGNGEILNLFNTNISDLTDENFKSKNPIGLRVECLNTSNQINIWKCDRNYHLI